MTGEIPQRVTCEVCGTSYDPRESRGWCPNPACGKWQHPDFPLSAGGQGGQEEAADGGVQAPTKICPGCGKEIRADANFCKFCSYEFPVQESDGDDGGEPEQAGLDQCPTCDADLSSIPPERLDDCPICGRDLESLVADRGEPEVSPADLDACPACQADLSDIPSDMRRICPDCRVSLEEAIAEHGVGGGGGAGGSGAGTGTGTAGPGSEAGGTGTAETAGTGAAGGGAEPAAASDPVDTIKGIGSSYASRLGDQGVETVGDLVNADLAMLSAATDISEKRLGEWVEKAPVDAAELGETPPGSESDATGGEPAARGQAQSSDAGTAEASGTGGGQGAGSQRGSGAGTQAGQATGAGSGQGAGGQGGQATGAGSGQGAGGQGGQATGAGSGQGAGGQGPGSQHGAGAGTQGGQGRQGSGGNRRGGRSQGPRDAGGGGGGQPDQGRAQGGAPTPGAGADRTGHRRRYDTVVFEVEGKEIEASPGETVGREIRTAMVESGAPKEDAVYVHREHLRVERDGGTFYLVRLGQNSLKVNGEPVDQGARAPVESGDDVSFSEVVSGSIRLE
jgi:hypothetical protein